ncbi:MAG: hypothetical protein PHZ09_00355 [Eubacteriales bacterium]|nr:hypothetical protein [Eubacteriales bacterium]
MNRLKPDNAETISPEAVTVEVELPTCDGDYYIADVIDFSECELSDITSIKITDSITGNIKTISEDAGIGHITAFIGKISGSQPVSSRGYYGFLYYVVLYANDENIAEITFTGNNTFNYGLFERVGSFLYPCRYIMSGVSEKEVTDTFARNFS